VVVGVEDGSFARSGSEGEFGGENLVAEFVGEFVGPGQVETDPVGDGQSEGPAKFLDLTDDVAEQAASRRSSLSVVSRATASVPCVTPRILLWL
jgi:hypothetical protein